MPRRARTYATYTTYATNAVLAIALAGTLTACTDSSGPDSSDNANPGGSSTSASAAPPGKYRTLPEPCGTVSINTLKDMLPGAAASEEAEGSESAEGDGSTADPTPSAYDGEASVTYDTDRRVGCRWKNATTLGTRHLNIDFERVVSYDPAVSDDEQAERLYDRRASKAEIPVASTPPKEEGDSGDDDSGAEKGETPDGGASPKSSSTEDPGESSEAPESESSSGDAGEDVAPRTLDDIGDTAYINDKLDTGDSGLHRDITLVFRTANVIATVEYDQWVTDKHRIPDSRELQEKARKLAEQLAAQFEED